MLRKISITHRKRFKDFCEENWTGKGANSKKQHKHAGKGGAYSNARSMGLRGTKMG
jgi:hypothetical protein